MGPVAADTLQELYIDKSQPSHPSCCNSLPRLRTSAVTNTLKTPGWYVENFSHARRVLFAAGSPEAAFPTDDPSVARWDGTDCLSMWALNGRGAGGAGGR